MCRSASRSTARRVTSSSRTTTALVTPPRGTRTGRGSRTTSRRRVSAATPPPVTQPPAATLKQPADEDHVEVRLRLGRCDERERVRRRRHAVAVSVELEQHVAERVREVEGAADAALERVRAGLLAYRCERAGSSSRTRTARATRGPGTSTRPASRTSSRRRVSAATPHPVTRPRAAVAATSPRSRTASRATTRRSRTASPTATRRKDDEKKQHGGDAESGKAKGGDVDQRQQASNDNRTSQTASRHVQGEAGGCAQRGPPRSRGAWRPTGASPAERGGRRGNAMTEGRAAGESRRPDTAHAERDRARDARLVAAVREHDDPGALHTLVAGTSGSFAVSPAARRTTRPGRRPRSGGLVGLLKAIQRFDPERGVPFPAYASGAVSGEIRHPSVTARPACASPSRCRSSGRGCGRSRTRHGPRRAASRGSPTWPHGPASSEGRRRRRRRRASSARDRPPAPDAELGRSEARAELEALAWPGSTTASARSSISGSSPI